MGQPSRETETGWFVITTSCQTGISISGGQDMLSPGSTSQEERLEEGKLVPPRPLPLSQDQSLELCVQRFVPRLLGTTSSPSWERVSPLKSLRKPVFQLRLPQLLALPWISEERTNLWNLCKIT